MKILLTIISMFIIETQSLFAAIDIGLFNSSAGSGFLEVRIRPTSATTNSDIYSAVTFTITYPDSYGVDLTVSSSSFGFAVNPSKVCVVSTTKQAIFVSTPNTNLVWSAGQEIVIATIAVSPTGIGTGTFTLATLATCPNAGGDFDGNHYQELNSAEVTGIVYQSTASNVTLPLSILNFKAQSQGDNIALKWLTSEEKAFKGFDIQRSLEGKEFNSLNWENARGNGTYTYLDKAVEKGQLYYYRLKMVDNDGQYKFSTIQSAIISGKNRVGVYPNPTNKNAFLEIESEVASESDSQIQLVNVQGQIVLSQRINVSKGQNIIPLTLENLPSGLYFMFLNLKTEQIQLKISKM